MEILHPLFRVSPGKPGFSVTVKLEVRPKCAGQEPDAIEDERVVIQHVDVICCRCFECVNRIDVVVVILMVPRNVDDRFAWKLRSRPFNAARADTNIAR